MYAGGLTVGLTLCGVAALRVNSAPVSDTTGASPSLLSYVITADKSAYRIGEEIKVDFRIKNEQNKAVFLVGSLDGSSEKMRYPHCYDEIIGPDNQVIRRLYARCGNTNPSRTKDFVRVRPKAFFSPYQDTDSYGSFPPRRFLATKDIFSKPGVYKLKLTYSTASDPIEQWLGDGRQDPKLRNDQKLLELFRQVPKVHLVSNVLTFRIR